MRSLAVPPLVLLLASIAPAAAPDVRWPSGERLTYVDLSERYQKDGKQLKAFPVWVASEGFQPLQKPSPQSAPSGAAPLPFLTQVLLLGSTKDDFHQGEGGVNFYLIAAPGESGRNPSPLGWVPKVRVLTRNVCLTDERSEIRIKAMVVNSLTYLKEGSDAADVKLLPPRVRLAPDSSGKDEGAFRFFDFYFVWADTDPSKDKEGYALLGDIPVFNPHSETTPAGFRALSRIIGWVEKSRLCFWRTREAVQWDDLKWQDDPPRVRTEPGKAYATREHALGDLGRTDREPDARKAGAVVTEGKFLGGKPPLWEPRRMRYPLLMIRNDRDEELTHEAHGKNLLRKVGVIGDVYDEKGQQVMTEKARQAITAEIRRTEEQLSRTEILFVIDRTSSMADWWVATEKWVQKLIRQVRVEGRSVAVGFCFYGDVHPGIPGKEGKATLEEAVKLKGVIPGRLLDCDRDREELEEKLKYLANRNEVIEGGFRPEMVYAGLEIGLLEARWGGKEGARHARKMVVLIGDDGNHPLPADEENQVHDRIAQLCVPTRDDDPDYQTPIEFYALQVCRVASNPTDPTVLFQTQVEALIERIKQRSKLARAASFNAAADEARFFAVIDRRYAELTAHVAQKREELLKIRTGQVTAVTEIRDPEVVRILEGIAAKQKVKVEDLLKGVQAFDERYVWSINPRTNEPQIRRMMLVSGGELDRVIALFENFFTEPEPPSLEELAHYLIAAQSGDSKEGVRERANDFKLRHLDALRVKYGFSFIGELSKFLGYDLPAGKPRPEPDPLAERELKQKLQKKFYLLQDLRNENVYHYEQLGPSDRVKLKRTGEPEKLFGDHRRGFERDEDRAEAWSQKPRIRSIPRGKVIWYWVDFDREWP